MITGTVPAGDYVGVAFRNGVPGDPSGLHFLRAELVRTRGSARQLLEVGDPNRNDVRLSGFDPATSTIVADIAAIFAELNWNRTNACHGSEAVCETMGTAYGLDFDSGALLETQRIYRVE